MWVTKQVGNFRQKFSRQWKNMKNSNSRKSECQVYFALSGWCSYHWQHDSDQLASHLLPCATTVPIIWSWVWCPKSEVLMELTFACKWIYWKHFQSRIVQHENWLQIWVHGHDYLIEYRSEQKCPKLQILRCSFVQKRWKIFTYRKNLPFVKKNTCSCLTVSTSFSELNWDRPQEEEEKEDQ